MQDSSGFIRDLLFHTLPIFQEPEPTQHPSPPSATPPIKGQKWIHFDTRQQRPIKLRHCTSSLRLVSWPNSSSKLWTLVLSCSTSWHVKCCDILRCTVIYCNVLQRYTVIYYQDILWYTTKIYLIYRSILWYTEIYCSILWYTEMYWLWCHLVELWVDQEWVSLLSGVVELGGEGLQVPCRLRQFPLEGGQLCIPLLKLLRKQIVAYSNILWYTVICDGIL